jgi:hypothetical protein
VPLVLPRQGQSRCPLRVPRLSCLSGSQSGVGAGRWEGRSWSCQLPVSVVSLKSGGGMLCVDKSTQTAIFDMSRRRSPAGRRGAARPGPTCQRGWRSAVRRPRFGHAALLAPGVKYPKSSALGGLTAGCQFTGAPTFADMHANDGYRTNQHSKPGSGTPEKGLKF